MALTGPQYRQLQQALLSAFPTRGDLEMMVRFGLDENLGVIVGEGPLSSTVFELIRWAEAHGRLDDLLGAALAVNPTNPDLHAFSGELERARAAATAPEAARAPSRQLLYRFLLERFDLEELHTLCFDLGVDFDSLPGEGKAAKARELISFLERRGRLADMVEVGRHMRPDVPWEEALVPAPAPAVKPAARPTTQPPATHSIDPEE